jgi:hypothetical protein
VSWWCLNDIGRHDCDGVVMGGWVGTPIAYAAAAYEWCGLKNSDRQWLVGVLVGSLSQVGRREVPVIVAACGALVEHVGLYSDHSDGSPALTFFNEFLSMKFRG